MRVKPKGALLHLYVGIKITVYDNTRVLIYPYDLHLHSAKNVI